MKQAVFASFLIACSGALKGNSDCKGNGIDSSKGQQLSGKLECGTAFSQTTFPE